MNPEMEEYEDEDPMNELTMLVFAMRTIDTGYNPAEIKKLITEDPEEGLEWLPLGLYLLSLDDERPFKAGLEPIFKEVGFNNLHRGIRAFAMERKLRR